MLRVQPNFTTAGFNNIQNQKSYIAKANSNTCDTVSFGTKPLVPNHSEVLAKETKMLINRVVKKSEQAENKFVKAIEEFLGKFQKEQSEKLGAEVSITKVENKFHLAGMTSNGEKVVFDKDIILIKENDQVTKRFYIKRNNINLYKEIEGYKPGDLNKSLSEYLSVFLPPKKTVAK